MKKKDIFDIAWHIWNNLDQAPHDITIKHIIEAVPKEALIDFIDTLLNNEGSPDFNPEEDVLKKAKRLTGRTE